MHRGIYKPNWTSTMEILAKNCYQILAVNYFSEKGPSQMFNWVLNMALNCVCLNKVMYLIIFKCFLVSIVHFKHEIFTDISKLFLVSTLFPCQLLSIQTALIYSCFHLQPVVISIENYLLKSSIDQSRLRTLSHTFVRLYKYKLSGRIKSPNVFKRK